MRETLHVNPALSASYHAGQRVEVAMVPWIHAARQMTSGEALSRRWATVVSWDEVSGELVVEYDVPAPDPTRGGLR